LKRCDRLYKERVMISCDSTGYFHLQGIRCVEAPGEAEAMCAALTIAGTADLVWTADVVDTLLFGATAVVTHTKNQDKSRAAMLSYKTPHTSNLHVIRREGVPKYLQDEVR
jgi:5'-3' exonuclease